MEEPFREGVLRLAFQRVDPADRGGRLGGFLRASAESFGFVGTTEELFFDGEPLVRFASALAAYPLPSEPIRLSSRTDREIDDEYEYLGLEVSPKGLKGQVRVRVHLAASFPGEPSHDVRMEILTTYESLRRFSEDLRAALGGQNIEAVLAGEKLI